MKKCFNLVAKESCSKSDRGYVCKECTGESLEEASLSDIAAAYNSTNDANLNTSDIVDIIDPDFVERDYDGFASRSEFNKAYGLIRRRKPVDIFDKSRLSADYDDEDINESVDILPETDIEEPTILCPECGEHTFNRIAESCKHCGFSTKEIMLEDTPTNFVQSDNKKAPSADNTKIEDTDSKELVDAVTARLNQEYKNFENKVTKKVTKELKQAASTMVNAVNNLSTTTTDKFVEVGKVLAKNDQKIYDAVDDLAFKLS